MICTTLMRRGLVGWYVKTFDTYKRENSRVIVGSKCLVCMEFDEHFQPSRKGRRYQRDPRCNVDKRPAGVIVNGWRHVSTSREGLLEVAYRILVWLEGENIYAGLLVFHQDGKHPQLIQTFLLTLDFETHGVRVPAIMLIGV